MLFRIMGYLEYYGSVLLKEKLCDLRIRNID